MGDNGPMAVEAIAEHTEQGHADGVFHQFESIEQQNESYIVGMWSFLVTEVMFFGPLFFAYLLYRWQFQPQFYLVHKELNVALGGLNTVILLFSSFAVAMAVHFAQKKARQKQLLWLGLTLACAFGFLIVKYFEWAHKFHVGHVPGPGFRWEAAGEAGVVPAGIAEMFFSLYFGMTGLHGLHVVIGIICIGTLMILTARKSKLVESYIPTEMVGLYWHFVDLVWIFLFPLFYLMPQ